MTSLKSGEPGQLREREREREDEKRRKTETGGLREGGRERGTEKQVGQVSVTTVSLPRGGIWARLGMTSTNARALIQRYDNAAWISTLYHMSVRHSFFSGQCSAWARALALFALWLMFGHVTLTPDWVWITASWRTFNMMLVIYVI